jgi:hypothetical protein
MEISEESIRLGKIRSIVFRTMAAMQFIDLSASSKEHAQTTIQHWASKMCSGEYSPDIIEVAVKRVIVCLHHHE